MPAACGDRRLLKVAVFAAAVGIGACERLSVTTLNANLAEREANLHNYSFQKFKRKYGRRYKEGSDEHVMREAIFLQRLEEMKAHNADNKMWTKGVNKLTDWTEDELKSLRGHKPAPRVKSQAQSLMQTGPESSMCASLNQSCATTAGDGTCCDGLVCGFAGTCTKVVIAEKGNWNWADIPTGREVLDQGGCGSCWAVAATAAVQLLAVIASDHKFQHVLSPQNILDCTQNPKECGGQGGCQGATAELGFGWASTAGARIEVLCTGDKQEGCQKYEVPSSQGCQVGHASFLQGKANTSPFVRIQGFTRLPENKADAMVAALTTSGPLVASIVGGGIQGYSGGVINKCDDFNIDHAVLMMGFGKAKDPNNEGQEIGYWYIRNSWGKDWGDKGFFKILRALDPAKEPCGMDTDPAKGVACKQEDGQYPKEQYVCGTCGILSDTAYPHKPELPMLEVESK
eukprot:TRINITY_DN90316_c0_g1_i1.p1 TRINITY_DN90316_c0_g1~~TRINITY_DN90316_c0_g1_i1.p1  ORF type:complete len:457 (+),score=114.97 TRINITY_DN90316_c0_g1_i1:79-1449(+)